MTKVKNVQDLKFEPALTEIKQTNRLFLELLYNLSKYPHPQKAKSLVRKALFAFETDNVFIRIKAKK